MKRIRTRTLNTQGLAEFAAYLGRGPWTAEPPPVGLLNSDAYSRPFAPEVEIGVRKFSAKFEMGMEICTAFGNDGIDAIKDNGLWAWLSLALNDSTMPKKDGTWFVGAKSRHIVERIPGRLQDQGHRHLVKGAAMAVRRFDTEAKVLMGRPHEQSKIEEQIMSRKADMGLATATEVVRAAYRLYYDPDHDAVRRGAKGTGAGSIMRFVEVLTQLDVNFDVPSLTANSILSLLPAHEFGKFMKESASIS